MKPYQRCKVCFASRSDGVPISRSGLCPKCRTERWHQFVDEMSEKLNEINEIR